MNVGDVVRVICKDDPISPRAEVQVGDVGTIVSQNRGSWDVEFDRIGYVVTFASWELAVITLGGKGHEY